MIESVSSVQQGNSTLLRIQMKAPPKAVPGSFSIANPPRLALDFPDTGNGVGQNVVELAQGDVRSVTWSSRAAARGWC